jgi:tripeptidyl-peptidase-1
LDFTQDILAYKNPPLVSSISWSTDERQEGAAYNFRCDSEFQKMGVLGLSVLAASGDSGATGGGCQNGDHSFNPGYPTTSPYVTSVGATMLVGTPTTTKTPPVCQSASFKCALSGTEDPADENIGGYATGGGFSVYEARPSYQAAAVSAYLSDSSIPKPPASYYNSTNRGFPDVAANGYSILIYNNGRWETVGGTSASTPIWGGIYALINDILLKNNKAPLGFANPLLYQIWSTVPGAFLNIGDLTTNNDDGCQYGYTSNPNGWDPVTGLGTPNVGVILNWVQNNLSSFPN